MRVSALMTRSPITVTPDTSTDEAVIAMDRAGVRHLPVVENGQLRGLISDRDLLTETGWLPSRLRDMRSGQSLASKKHQVRELIHEPVMTTTPQDPVLTVVVEAAVQGLGCLPVIEGNKLVGIVTEVDMLRTFLLVCAANQQDTSLDPHIAGHMTREPSCLEFSSTIDEAIVECRRLEAHHLPILQSGHLIGILSDRDLRRARGRGRSGDRAVETIMQRSPTCLTPEAHLSEAARLMVDERISCLPILRDSVVVGILTTQDLLEHCSRELRERELPGSIAIEGEGRQS